ncbi:histidinol-phosphate transaminase [Paenibacillus septentrionalis]|uniref:Histidinol-phosphate aminotransferase n=1 Tax=Paenibacillus septentrionalis TaxID=429342 RepID=A0ABW1VAE5_9BACL
MSKYWSPLTASLEPYVPGEQPKDKTYIKLNTNENPYPPSPNAIAAMKAVINEDLRLYPDPNSEMLIQALAKQNGLSPKQIFVGNGSDEILAFAFASFFDPSKPVLFPDITYSFYKVYAKFYGITPKLIPLDEQFLLDVNQFKGEHGGIIIPNPNAPTAIPMPLADVKVLLDNNPDQVVIIDEAYVDFGAESAIALVSSYPNLLVIQTLSKSRSLAGLRVGYAFGSEELIEGLNRTKNSFNSYTIDRVALAGAVAAIEDQAYFQATTEKVVATRERVVSKLQTLGFIITPSKANFVFISHPTIAAKQLFEQLREQGVLVRYFASPRIDRFLRVSIGTDEEMKVFLEVIERLIG